MNSGNTPRITDEACRAAFARMYEERREAYAATGAVTCVKCGHRAMRSFGGWGHAPGYAGRRHVVVVTAPR